MCEKSEQICKHTPGPWLWRGKSGSLHQAGTDGYIYGPAVLEPVYDYDSGVDTSVSDADANLIAAAPDLLQSLKEISDMFMARPDMVRALEPLRGFAENAVFERAAAAIAKAEGRS